MTRYSTGLAIALALLTGLVAGLLGRVGNLVPEPVPAWESRAQQVGRAYYDAVDHLLQTGDPGSLTELLGADFRNQAAANEFPIAAEGLVLEYQSLRSSYPGVRQTISDLSGSGSLVIASVTTHGPEDGAFAGVEVEAVLPFEHQEILRIRDGRVIERWTDGTASPHLMTMASIEATSMSGAPEMRLFRFGLFAEEKIYARSDVILIVMSGALKVDQHGREQSMVHRYRTSPQQQGGIESRIVSDAIELQAGDVLIAPAGAEIELRNGSAEPAEFMAISSSFGRPGGMELANGTAAVTRTLIARGFSLRPETTRYDVHIGQATISAGTSLIHTGIEHGGEFVLPVSGSVDLEAAGGLVWTVDASQRPLAQERALFSPLEGSAVQGADEVRFTASAEHPATFWLVTFTPAVDRET